MARRNIKIQEFEVANYNGATRVTCGQLGPKSFQVVVAGDDTQRLRL